MALDIQTLLVSNFIFPATVGVLAFVGSNYVSERRNRKRQSIVGAAILESFAEEITIGIKLMKSINGMLSDVPPEVPILSVSIKSWSGINSISDMYLERIICVSKDIKPEGFPLNQIRIHLKNYFGNMSTWINNIANLYNANGDWQTPAKICITKGNFIDAGEGVLKMVMQAHGLLLTNSKKWFPK